MSMEFVQRITQLEKRIDRLASTRQLFDIGNEDTKAQFTANQNDYAPGDYDVLRLSSDASRDLTGITSGVQGRMLLLVNVGSNNIVLKHQSGSSTAANRLLISSHADATLLPGQSAVAYYDDTTQRWRVMNRPVTPTTAQIYSSAFSFGTYYLNGSMQLESTYAPTSFSTATLVHTNNTNRRVNKEYVRAGEYLYWMERIGTTWYITEYNITTTAEVSIAVSALTNPTTSYFCVASEHVVYYMLINTATQNTIYKLDFTAVTNTSFDTFAGNPGSYLRSSCFFMAEMTISGSSYLVICGNISNGSSGAWGYKKNLTSGAASVVTDGTVASAYNLFLGGQRYGNKVFLTGKPANLYPAESNSAIIAYCYDPVADSMTSGTVATLTSKNFDPYYSVVDNSTGIFYWYIKQTNDLDEQYYYIFYMDENGTGGITHQSVEVVATPLTFGLFQSRTKAYYYYSLYNGIDPGTFYEMDGSTVISPPSDFNPAPFYIGKRDINLDDNNNLWYWVETSNTLKSFNLTSGASNSYSLSVTDATSNPTNNKMSLLGNYIVFQTYFNTSTNSNIYLLK